MLKKFQQFLLDKTNIPIFLILITAAFMRLYHISEYLTFLGDEGRDVLIVWRILHGEFTLLGPTASVGGFFLGPIYYYFMAPFLFLFNYNPVGPAVMVALVGVATVWLVYKVTREFFGYYPALITSFLYAVSPLVIIYSRSSWNPNVVPFFSLLMLYVVYRAVTLKSWKLMTFAGVLFGILLQLHYLATFLGVAVTVYILIASLYQSRRIEKTVIAVIIKYLFFGLGTILGWLPFLTFELRHGFPNIQSILKFIFASGDTGGSDHYFATVQDVFIRLFGRMLLAFPNVLEMHLYPSNILQLWGFVIYLIGISSIVYCLVSLVQSAQKKEKTFYEYLLLLVWILTGIFLFGFYKKAIYDYYFGILFPVPFILFGGLVSQLLTKGKIMTGAVIFGVTLMITINWNFRPFKIPGNNQLKQVMDISEFVLSQTNGEPYNFAVISSGGNSDFAYRYFFETHHHPPVTIQFPGVDPERKTITSQLLIVCESVPCKPLGYPLWEVAGFGQADIAGVWDVSVIKVYKLIHFKKPQACAPGKICKV